MVKKILLFVVRFLPAEVTTWLWIAAILGAGAAIISARATSEQEELRQRNLESEIKQNENNALNEEINRQQELRFANAQAIVNAGNIDPFSSQSLLSIRTLNQQNTERDIRNLRSTNLFSKSANRNAILASKKRSQGASIGGILQAGQSLAGAKAE